MNSKIQVNPTFEDALEEISKEFKVTRSVARQDNLCVLCGKTASTFKNALSEREYSISGMCQDCQNSIFG